MAEIILEHAPDDAEKPSDWRAGKKQTLNAERPTPNIE
jgi:hypothetical protein